MCKLTKVEEECDSLYSNKERFATHTILQLDILLSMQSADNDDIVISPSVPQTIIAMFSGNVSLLINSATNLTDSFGILNTFVRVKVDNIDVFQTDISKHSFNPTWNEWTEWKSENAKHITFQIHNNDRTKQIVAQKKLSLHEVLSKQVGKKSVKLYQIRDHFASRENREK